MTDTQTWRHDADGYAYKPYKDAAGQPRRQYADADYLNALEAERDAYRAALEAIANMEGDCIQDLAMRTVAQMALENREALKSSSAEQGA